MPNHRKHCPKTFILPTVAYFAKYITNLHLNVLGGERSLRYVCIIYATLVIKCSQARVNNSRIKKKNLFRIYLCRQCLHLSKRFFWKIHIKFFSKNVVGRAIFHFEQKFCPVYHICYLQLFFTLMAEKTTTYFKLNHSIINCIFL